ncbi:hypothetical protein MSAN_01997900 [Mycena sanguinolenta]|uniref:Secreted protein n=1 Tax=Mycena sanguinolenta TaxID=230812 RepID=A0A8H7CM49_9AGAR|nr:hypothetical protein MSAN_01997900 [Mycena sanguinolenta]
MPSVHARFQFGLIMWWLMDEAILSVAVDTDRRLAASALPIPPACFHSLGRGHTGNSQPPPAPAALRLFPKP